MEGTAALELTARVVTSGNSRMCVSSLYSGRHEHNFRFLEFLLARVTCRSWWRLESSLVPSADRADSHSWTCVDQGVELLRPHTKVRHHAVTVSPDSSLLSWHWAYHLLRFRTILRKLVQVSCDECSVTRLDQRPSDADARPSWS